MATWLFCCVTCPQKWIAALFPSHISQFHAWHLFESLCLTTMWSLSSTILLLVMACSIDSQWDLLDCTQEETGKNATNSELTACNHLMCEETRKQTWKIRPLLSSSNTWTTWVLSWLPCQKWRESVECDVSYWFCKCYKTSKCRASTHHKLRIQPNQARG